MYSLSFAVKSNTAKGVFGVSAEKRDLFWERALLKRHPCLIPLNLFQLKCAHKKVSLSLYLCALRISEFNKPVPAFSRVRREGWTRWLGHCCQNLAWGQNQEFWLSKGKQHTKKKEVIFVQVNSALNTGWHFYRVVNLFSVSYGLKSGARIVYGVVFCTSHAEKKKENWAWEGVAVTPEGATSLHSALAALFL